MSLSTDPKVPMPAPTLRLATAADAPVLTNLVFRAKASNGYDAAFMEACREELRVTPATIASGDFWLVEQGNTVIGCAKIEPTPDPTRAEITTFFVDPDHQRQGIGHLLWTRIRDRAAQVGITLLYLGADPAAVRFYRALGFVTTGQLPSGSIPGRMLPRMELHLTGQKQKTTATNASAPSPDL